MLHDGAEVNRFHREWQFQRKRGLDSRRRTIGSNTVLSMNVASNRRATACAGRSLRISRVRSGRGSLDPTFRDDAIMLLFCPTCQGKFAKSEGGATTFRKVMPRQKARWRSMPVHLLTH